MVLGFRLGMVLLGLRVEAVLTLPRAKERGFTFYSKDHNR
jgi:hypothetical protein